MPTPVQHPSADPLESGHWRTCLMPEGLKRVEDAEAAAFFVRVYARDLIYTGHLNHAQARRVVRHYAEQVGCAQERADQVLDDAWADRAPLATGGGDEAKVDAALRALATQGVVSRIGVDCCRDAALEAVEHEHGPEDRFYGVSSLADLMRVDRAHRLDLAFSYLDGQLPQWFTPELLERATGGDKDAQLQWLATIDRAEITAGGALAAALRATGLDVEWGGSNQEVVSVHTSAWLRPLPLGQ